MHSIDNTQDQKIQSGRFTDKTVRWSLAKLINISIEINCCCSCIQNVKLPLEWSGFARETDIITLAFFDLGCCLH